MADPKSTPRYRKREVTSSAREKLTKRPKRSGPRRFYDCVKCPAFCCSIYERVVVKPFDLRRLAHHFGISEAQARLRFTKLYGRERILRRKRDPMLGETCRFLDTETRGCGIYAARPGICREYPGESRCGYYDVLQFERRTQGDKHVLPLFQITFPGPRERRAPASKARPKTA